MTSPGESTGPLSGTNVLIIEDEFYLAMEIQEGIERAGGKVVGPFPEGPDAAALASSRPDCAIVDINLGNGPSFDLPRILQQLDVPFVFLTGYDEAAIPAEFAGVQRVEKPARMDKVIEALARLRNG